MPSTVLVGARVRSTPEWSRAPITVTRGPIAGFPRVDRRRSSRESEIACASICKPGVSNRTNMGATGNGPDEDVVIPIAVACRLIRQLDVPDNGRVSATVVDVVGDHVVADDDVRA